MTDQERTHDLGQGEQRTTTAPMSRFRPAYRKLTDGEKALHDQIKAKAVEMEALIAQVDESRAAGIGLYKSLALTALEESVMWAVKGLTS